MNTIPDMAVLIKQNYKKSMLLEAEEGGSKIFMERNPRSKPLKHFLNAQLYTAASCDPWSYFFQLRPRKIVIYIRLT